MGLAARNASEHSETAQLPSSLESKGQQRQGLSRKSRAPEAIESDVQQCLVVMQISPCPWSTWRPRVTLSEDGRGSMQLTSSEQREKAHGCGFTASVWAIRLQGDPGSFSSRVAMSLPAQRDYASSQGPTVGGCGSSADGVDCSLPLWWQNLGAPSNIVKNRLLGEHRQVLRRGEDKKAGLWKETVWVSLCLV